MELQFPISSRQFALLALVALAVGLWPCRASDDTVPPFITGVGSLHGQGIGVNFSEAVDPVTATVPGNYLVHNFAIGMPDRYPAVTNVILRPNGRSVQLELSELLILPRFQVWATNVQDLAGNVITNELPRGGDVNYSLVADLPEPGVNPAVEGSVFMAGGIYEIKAGGSGLMDTQDGFHYLFNQRTGDFILRVNIASLAPASRWSQAGIMVRETLLPGSRMINVMATSAGVPAADGSGLGADRYLATWREVPNGPVTEWPESQIIGGLTYPNVWVSLSRRGQIFTASVAPDNLQWTRIAQFTVTNPFPATAFVGLATTSGNNAPEFSTLVEYRGFGEASVTTPPAPRLNIARHDGSLVVSWLHVPGYNLRHAAALDAPEWSVPIPPDIQIHGTNQVWFDPAGPGGFLRLVRP